jgi:predicted PurR-regulated permease PerM
MTAPARRLEPGPALWVLATLATLAFVKLAADLLIPIVLSLLAALALEPVVAWLTRHRVPRGLAAALVLLVIAGAAAWGLYTLRDNVASVFDALPSLVRRVRQAIDSAMAATSLDATSRALQGGGGAASGGGAAAAAPAAGRLGAIAMSMLGHATVILFLVFFLLQSGPRMTARLAGVARTPERRTLVASVLADINTQVQRFLLVTAFTALLVAVVTWVAMASMGVQYALLWGVLAGVFNSIPYFGPVVVSGGMFAVGLVQQGGAAMAWKMAGVALLITAIEGWLVTPPLMGRAERMNVLSVFFGLLLWTWLWGPWGTLLAVPMLAVVKSVADHVPALKPLGRLLAA